jgi:hypothetical protein
MPRVERTLLSAAVVVGLALEVAFAREVALIAIEWIPLTATEIPIPCQ